MASLRSRETIERQIALLEHRKDPAAELLRALFEVTDRQGGMSREDMDRLAREAAAGASAMGQRLADVAVRRYRLQWMGTLLGAVVVAFGAGWLLHGPAWLHAPWEAPPTCAAGVCWYPVRIGQ
jgi:hypothetical protein